MRRLFTEFLKKNWEMMSKPAEREDLNSYVMGFMFGVKCTYINLTYFTSNYPMYDTFPSNYFSHNFASTRRHHNYVNAGMRIKMSHQWCIEGSLTFYKWSRWSIGQSQDQIIRSDESVKWETLRYLCLQNFVRL